MKIAFGALKFNQWGPVLMACGVLFYGCSSKENAPKSYIEKTAQEDGYSYTYIENDPLQARTYKLENGLTVMLSQNKREPRIQTYIGIRAGSAKDPATATGLAHYLEHMLFKGTSKLGTLNWDKEKVMLDSIKSMYEFYRQTKDAKKRDEIYGQIDRMSLAAARFAVPNEYDKLLAGLGAQGTNAYTWFDQTVYVNDIPSNAIERWAATEGERFGELAPRLFHTELEAVYEEKNRSLDSDGEKQFDQFMSSLMPGHPYGTQTTIGTIEHLKNPSIVEIQKFFDTWYVPNNMIVSMAGDLDYAETIKTVEKYFGKLKKKDLPEVKMPAIQPLTAPQEHTVYGPEAENVMVGYQVSGATSEDIPVLEVIKNLMTNSGGVGIIDVNLNQSQKVRSPMAFGEELNDAGFYMLSASPKEGQALTAVKDLLLAQTDSLKEGKFADWLLDAVKLNIRTEGERARKDNHTRANEMLYSFITNRPYMKYVTFYDDVDKVTKQQVTEIAKKYFNGNYVAVYKKTGEDPNRKQVPKPKINPVPLNRDTTSAKFNELVAISVKDMAPVFPDFGKVKQASLRDGVDFVGLKNETDQDATLYLLYKKGFNADKYTKLAFNYLEYLGTDKFTATQLKAEFYKLGLSFVSFPSSDKTYFGISGADKNLEKGMDLLMDFLANAKADETALENLKGDVLRTRTDAKLDKNTILYSQLMPWIKFGPKNPANFTYTNEELKKITSAELLSVVKGFKNNQVQVLYFGPQEAESVQKLVNDKFVVSLPKTLQPLDGKPPFLPAKAGSKTWFVPYEMVQAEIVMINCEQPRNDNELALRSLYSYYFGGDMSSVVFQELRESKALAYSTYASFTETNPFHPLTYMAYIGSQADKGNEAVASMKEIIYNLPVSPNAFAKAKEGMKKQISTSRTLDMNIVFAYLAAKEYGRDKTTDAIIWESIDKLTLDDIVKYQKERIKPLTFTMGVLADKKKLPKDFFAKHAPVTEVSLTELFGY